MKRVAGGLVAGLSATLLMEYASNAIWKRQGDEAKQKENELRSEMPTTVLVKKLASAAGTELGDDKAQKAGMVAHYAFGAAGGPAAQALMTVGATPMKAAMTVAAGMELLVDQGANTALGLTAPSWEFPAVANVRAVAAHVAYGLALGLMLTAGGDGS
jgi:hypothetical protein